MDQNRKSKAVGKFSEPPATLIELPTKHDNSQHRVAVRRVAETQAPLNSSTPQPLLSEEHLRSVHGSVEASIAADCIRIKDLGYSSSHHIQMYGERFDIVSDPFPAGTGVAVEVTSLQQPKKRALRLPTSILVGHKEMFKKAK
jgi:hypothetical protein